MSQPGCLIVISGASGTGKGTVCAALFKLRPTLEYSISATTRQPRPGETDGVEYFFKSRSEFERLIADGGLLEWADVYGNYYGTPQAPVEAQLAAGRDVLLEIDTQGALNVMKARPDGVFIFLLPPSLYELERRLRERGTDSEAVIRRRLDAARDEIALAAKYRYVVVNDEVDRAAAAIDAIISTERERVGNNNELLQKVMQG